MAEVSGDVSGASVANGANSSGGQGLWRTVAGGEIVADETHYNIAQSKATTAQTILCPEGRPDIALHNAINL